MAERVAVEMAGVAMEAAVRVVGMKVVSVVGQAVGSTQYSTWELNTPWGEGSGIKERRRERYGRLGVQRSEMEMARRGGGRGGGKHRGGNRSWRRRRARRRPKAEAEVSGHMPSGAFEMQIYYLCRRIEEAKRIPVCAGDERRSRSGSVTVVALRWYDLVDFVLPPQPLHTPVYSRQYCVSIISCVFRGPLPLSYPLALPDETSRSLSIYFRKCIARCFSQSSHSQCHRRGMGFPGELQSAASAAAAAAGKRSWYSTVARHARDPNASSAITWDALRGALRGTLQPGQLAELF